MQYIAYFLSLIPFYLIGSFPSGFLIARIRGIDLATSGSGNVGAANVTRVVGKQAGLFTLCLDLFKGLFSVWLATHLTSNQLFSGLAGLSAVCGHCFSIPGKLKGGKGVATGLGVLLGLSPLIALVAVITFVSFFKLTRIVSLSSICATLIVPLICILRDDPWYLALPLVAITFIVLIRHLSNLNRLMCGTEPRFEYGKAGRSVNG